MLIFKNYFTVVTRLILYRPKNFDGEHFYQFQAEATKP